MALSTTRTQTKKTKPDSNNSQDESGELNSGADAANSNSAQNPEEKKRRRKNNGGKYGFDDYPSSPTFEVKVDCYNKGDCCLHCQAGKLYNGEARKQLQFNAHAPIEVNRYIREVLRCNRCGQEIIADLPKNFRKWTYAAKSKVVLYKTHGMPFYRLQKLQSMYQIPLPANTMWQQCNEIWEDGAKQVYGELLQLLGESHYLNVDDTGVKILEAIESDKSKPDKDRRACHSTTISGDTVDGYKIEVYISAQDYAGNNIKPLIENSKNLNSGHHLKIMGDASSMNKPSVEASLSSQIHMVNCLEHGRRKFYDIKEDYVRECAYFLKEINAIFAYERQFKEEKPGKRLKLRKQFSAQHIGNIYREIDRLLSKKEVEPNSSLGKAMKYWLNNRKGLTAFLRMKDVGVSNNRAERSLKTLILQRKNSLFFKTMNSAEILSGLSSIVQTCKMNEVNGFAYLNWLQENSSKCIANPKDYLPWRFKEINNETERIKHAA